uniref:T cell receptor delta constant n=1 Tax=Equus asinus TaxID=9793 RepID=A0A9L0I9S8_EQUAS
MCSWDTRQMFFGAGIKLFVESRSQPVAKPSVFIMKNETNVACLVKDFYPKNIKISFESPKTIKEFEPAIVVSPSGKYSAVKLGQFEDPNSVTCLVQHENEKFNSTYFEKSQRRSKRSSGDPEPMKHENSNKTSEICHEPKVHAEKVNMLSLTVLGLRMLFAKSVAINFLLTAKLFLF